MPPPHDDDAGHPLRDLENGQYSRLLTDEERSDVLSSSLSSPSEPSVGGWLADKILGARLSAWIQGPRLPRPCIISPLGGDKQLVCLERPGTWLSRRWQRELAALAFFALWFLSFVVVIDIGNSAGDDHSRFSCISRFWYVNISLLGQWCTEYVQARYPHLRPRRPSMPTI
jgi:hypothetical protein